MSEGQELILSKEQKRYLDNSGIMDAKTLQLVFKKSVQDQQKTQKAAEKIRNKQK